MRSQAFWLGVIGLALAAIVAGYVSGASSARLSVQTLKRNVHTSVHAVLRDPSDSAVNDIFSGDDVVIDRPLAGELRWAQPRIAVVVGLCGYDASAESAFLAGPFPVAIDVDPRAPQAARVAELAREAHDLVLVHVGTAPSPVQLAALRRRLGAFDGIASRATSGFVQALDGANLLFFDERGDADGDDFTGVDVPFAQRDVTADDRTGQNYIRFMLERTVQRSERAGRLVVLVRPRPHSLAALNALAATRSVEFVPLTQRI